MRAPIVSRRLAQFSDGLAGGAKRLNIRTREIVPSCSSLEMVALLHRAPARPPSTVRRPQNANLSLFRSDRCNRIAWQHSLKVSVTFHDTQIGGALHFTQTLRWEARKNHSSGLLLRQAWLAGKISRASVLAPKNVCKQWQIELREKFNPQLADL